MQGRVSRPRPVLRFLYSNNTTLNNNTRAGSADPGQYSGSYIVPIPLLLIILGPGQQTQTSAQVPIHLYSIVIILLLTIILGQG